MVKLWNVLRHNMCKYNLKYYLKLYLCCNNALEQNYLIFPNRIW